MTDCENKLKFSIAWEEHTRQSSIIIYVEWVRMQDLLHS